MFVLDSQLLNSYILYATDRRALGLLIYSRSMWHYTVAEDLIRPRMNAGRIRGPIRNLPPEGYISAPAMRPCVNVAWSVVAGPDDYVQGAVGSFNARELVIGQCIPSAGTSPTCGRTCSRLWNSQCYSRFPFMAVTAFLLESRGNSSLSRCSSCCFGLH